MSINVTTTKIITSYKSDAPHHKTLRSFLLYILLLAKSFKFLVYRFVMIECITQNESCRNASLNQFYMKLPIR